MSSYWRAKTAEVYRVNVEGTRIVMDACLRAGAQRVVHTSSVGAVGIRSDGRPADETQPFNERETRFAYAHSKHLAEQEVLKAVKLGLPAVMVNPAVVIGAGDHNLISGSMIVEMAKRPLPAAPPGGVCMVDAGSKTKRQTVLPWLFKVRLVSSRSHAKARPLACSSAVAIPPSAVTRKGIRLQVAAFMAFS